MHPFGELRSDLRNAMLACLIHNQWAKKKRSPRDFMLRFEPEEKLEQTLEEQKETLCKLTHILGGTVVKG